MVVGNPPFETHVDQVLATAAKSGLWFRQFGNSYHVIPYWWLGAEADNRLLDRQLGKMPEEGVGKKKCSFQIHFPSLVTHPL